MMNQLRKLQPLHLLLGALVLFVVTRAVALTAFPIFNDEALYLQYAQRIHDDWEQHRYISMHGEFADWKPPLQFWLAAPFIRTGGDPLLAGRAVAAVFSLLGLAGFWLFAKELFGPREGVVAALLYVLCPPVLFHNVQFTAETFLFATAAFFYWATLRSFRAIGWVVAAAALGSALLLWKQSGALLLLLALFLPLVSLGAGWKRAGLHLLLVGVVIACAHGAAALVIPAEFNETRGRFNSHWVMSARELWQLPVEAWRGNLRVVADYTGAYYGWPVVLFCGVLALRRWNPAELTLLLTAAAGGGAIIFLLRGFNEYMFHTAVIAVLLPLLARGAVLLWEQQRSWKRWALQVLVAFTAGFWVYQIVLMASAPGRYLERSTRWAQLNYLQSWSTGFGVREVVAMLEREQGSGVVFADTQWGNPRTALELYRDTRFPQLRIVPISREFLEPAGTRQLRDDARQMAEVRYAVFSADRSGPRAQWVQNIEREMCETRVSVSAFPGQVPIVVCRF